jgi:hypothetical protein
MKKHEDGSDNLCLNLPDDDLKKSIEVEKTGNDRLLSSKQNYNQNEEYCEVILDSIISGSVDGARKSEFCNHTVLFSYIPKLY